VAPPETILERKTVPGACWPLQGSKGQVTMRLPYPVFVDSVTVDHVNSELVHSLKHQTAPKTMKVIGYPACSKSDHCYALGFDMNDPIEIARINYDIEGSTIQTFDTIFAQADNVQSIDDSDGEEGSCSAEKASCTAPPRVSMGGITLKVLDNWGNDQYTCLYRFRVHGQPDL
jgi:SUN domain-containing protein 1/2